MVVQCNSNTIDSTNCNLDTNSVNPGLEFCKDCHMPLRQVAALCLLGFDLEAAAIMVMRESRAPKGHNTIRGTKVVLLQALFFLFLFRNVFLA